jgi:hypothetical protein
MIADEELASLTAQERTEVIAKLVDMSRLPTMSSAARLYRGFVLRVVTVGALLLIPWIIFLGVELPRVYTAANWSIAWQGFDVGLFIALGVTAWAVWRRRQILIISSVVAGTMLIVDAWFDMVTSAQGNDTLLAVLSGCLIELPLALMLFATAVRIIRMNARALNVMLGGDGEIKPLMQMPLFFAQIQALRQRTNP